MISPTLYVGFIEIGEICLCGLQKHIETRMISGSSISMNLKTGSLIGCWKNPDGKLSVRKNGLRPQEF